MSAEYMNALNFYKMLYDEKLIKFIMKTSQSEYPI